MDQKNKFQAWAVTLSGYKIINVFKENKEIYEKKNHKPFVKWSKITATYFRSI